MLETIYESALCRELELRNIPYQRQVSADITYKNIVIQGQRLDMLVQGEVIVELKSQANLPDYATAQLLSYLKATGLKRGLLINFAEAKLTNGVKRVSL